jgi:hypothetical protein
MAVSKIYQYTSHSQIEFGTIDLPLIELGNDKFAALLDVYDRNNRRHQRPWRPGPGIVDANMKG